MYGGSDEGALVATDGVAAGAVDAERDIDFLEVPDLRSESAADRPPSNLDHPHT